MGGLVGFILGYYVGAKDGPERLEELRQALDSILASPDFQALRGSAALMVQQALTQLQTNVGANKRPDAITAGAAWKLIAESEEFRGLLASGAAMLQGVLSNVTPQKRGNGHAEL